MAPRLCRCCRSRPGSAWSMTGRRPRRPRHRAYALPRFVLGSTARLLGEHAPERVLSLVLCGNQPYAWNFESPIAHAVGEAIASARQEGMTGFVATFESALGRRFPDPNGHGRWRRTIRPRSKRRGVPYGPKDRSLTTCRDGRRHASSAPATQTRCTTRPSERQKRSPERASSHSSATHTSLPSTKQTTSCYPTSTSCCGRDRPLRRLRVHHREEQRGRVCDAHPRYLAWMNRAGAGRPAQFGSGHAGYDK